MEYNKKSQNMWVECRDVLTREIALEEVGYKYNDTIERLKKDFLIVSFAFAADAASLATTSTPPVSLRGLKATNLSISTS